VKSPTASASAPPTLDALLDDADRARREGRTQEALSLLARVASSRDDARAALASFTRAKLELQDPADLVGATQDLERALARGLPAPLDEDARARLVDAYTRTGRNDDARRVAAEMRVKNTP
jgi:transmembrane sensor